MEPHRRAEQRSLLYHRATAQRLADQPHLLERARQRVAAWCAAGPSAPAEAEAWAEVLAGDALAVAALLCEDSERGRALRQSSPFAGALSPIERWDLWHAVPMPSETRR